MNDCIFCKIINKEAPSEVVYEDENTLAIKTIAPVSSGHTLVIPKKHSENIFDIDSDSFNKLMSVTQTLSVKLKEEYNATGVNILHASGKDAEQSVMHFHMHIVPRYPNDGLNMWIKKGL